MAFNTPAGCSNPIKPVSDNSLSTHSFQPKAVPDPNSKRMGTGSKVPWQMTRSQQSPRNIRIVTAKGKPHMARRRRRVITGNFWEVAMGIIPRVYEKSTLTIGIVSYPLLLHLTQQDCQRQLFPFMAGRTLAFRRCHGVAVDRSIWMVVFERENMVRKGRG